MPLSSSVLHVVRGYICKYLSKGALTLMNDRKGMNGVAFRVRRHVRLTLMISISPDLLSAVDRCFSEFFQGSKNPGLNYAISYRGALCTAALSEAEL